MKEQFTIKLKDEEGERGNFFNYGAFEAIIESGWMLVQRIKISGGEILLFEFEYGWVLDRQFIPRFQKHWPFERIPRASLYQGLA